MTHEQLSLEQDPPGAAGHMPPTRGGIAWWPSVLGVGLALVGGVDAGTSATLASVVAVIALIYVGAAAVDRPGWAWPGFLLSIPVVISGALTGAWSMPFVIMAVVAIILIVIGLATGAWQRSHNRIQLYALAGFGMVSVAGAVTSGAVAAALIAGGLLAHSVWDVIHHRRCLVVERRYAEFCAALDAAIAATIVWGVVS